MWTGTDSAFVSAHLPLDLVVYSLLGPSRRLHARGGPLAGKHLQYFWSRTGSPPQPIKTTLKDMYGISPALVDLFWAHLTYQTRLLGRIRSLRQCIFLECPGLEPSKVILNPE